MAKALEQQIWPYEVYSQPKEEPKQYGRGVKLSREDIEGFIKQDNRLLDCEQAYIGWES